METEQVELVRQSPRNQAGQHNDVHVRRYGEDAARLLDPTQVCERDQRDRRETEQHALIRQ